MKFYEIKESHCIFLCAYVCVMFLFWSMFTRACASVLAAYKSEAMKKLKN